MSGQTCPSSPLYEALAAEFARIPTQWRAYAASLDTDNWKKHALRQELESSAVDVLPYGLFEDAATYKGKGAGTRDSLECCYINALGQRARRAICCLPKSRFCGEECGCPCRGRCTKNAMDKVLLWFSQVAASGYHPQCRHDGSPFPAGRSYDKRGTALVTEDLAPFGIRFVLMEYRADWLQISTGLGFPAANQEHFCWRCNASKHGKAFAFEQSWCWPLRDHDTYLREAAAVQIKVSVDRDTAENIFANLSLDWRQQGMHGRVVGCDIAVLDLDSMTHVDLRRHDRLEALEGVTDIHCSPEALSYPCALVFFRTHPRVFLKFVPLLVSIPFFRIEYLTQDILHTLDQGVTAKLAATAIQLLLRHGKFGNQNSRLGFAHGLRAFNQHLKAYASARRREYHRLGKGSFATFHRLTLHMLRLQSNTTASPMLLGKGAEIRHLLPLCISLVKRHFAEIPKGRELLVSMVSLQRSYDIMQQHGANMPVEAKDDLDHCLKQCGINARSAGVRMIPKFHMLPHLGAQTYYAGNLRFHSTIDDESNNADIVRVAATAHAREFLSRVLAKQCLLVNIETEEMSVSCA